MSRIAKALPGYRAEGDGAAQGHFARARRIGGEEGGFPILGHADREVPRIGCMSPRTDPLVPAEFARGFVHGAIKSVAIDGCGRRVEPDLGRIGEFADDLAEQAGAANARIVDGDAIGFSVAAVDAAAGEIDAHVGALEVLGPWADGLAVPAHGLLRRRIGQPRQHGHVVATLLKIAGEHLADLAAASGHDNAKRARCEGCNGVHSSSVQGSGGRG